MDKVVPRREHKVRTEASVNWKIPSSKKQGGEIATTSGHKQQVLLVGQLALISTEESNLQE